MKRSTRGLLIAGLAFFITGAALGIASLSAGFRYEDFVEAVEQGKFRLVGPEQWTADGTDSGAGTISPDEHHEEDVQSSDGHHEEDAQSSDGHHEEDVQSSDEHHEVQRDKREQEGLS